MKVLITGGNGFLGREVAKTLRAQAGMHVLVTARTPRETSDIMLDVTSDIATVACLLKGVECVAHCVAGNEDTTIRGTHNLLEACKLAHVKRIVLISSIAVYGSATGVVNEKSPRLQGGRRNYATWKAKVEEISQTYADIEIVILRPTIIYGPDSPLWVSGIKRRIQTGYWGTFGAAGEGSCNLVHVTDVAEAVKAALIAPDVSGQVFNINGPSVISWNAWFQTIADVMQYGMLPNIPEMTLWVRTVLSLPFKLVRKVSGITLFKWVDAAPALSELTLFRLKAFYPTDRAKIMLNWSARISLQEGLATLSHSSLKVSDSD
ncbi:NAD(P)-dependent oxidoreductase [Acetobacter orientalis]|uniref:NAD-dependent epimerase/dehydratase family protein n=1 Tax=Acetobacter orientalis TaxID=146474 RepID=UPI0020A35E38|nr:NAD(P)-dependent oxidoreductase [Acetobacter orientalis]MCP1220300.1 NAD(P)-dependent oxidoreductase [Acetobacter orientalis]